MDDNEELTSTQLKVIPYLLKALSVEDGCRRARVSKGAVYHWLENESFREEQRRQREQWTTIAFETLAASAVKATTGLVSLLQSPTITFGSRRPKRLSGSRATLDMKTC